jgi:hypothetical protein
VAHDLDALIRAAKLVEQPSALDRERVRRELDARVLQGAAASPGAGGAFFPAYSGVFVGIACAAAVGLGLWGYFRPVLAVPERTLTPAPVEAPAPPPPSVSAAPAPDTSLPAPADSLQTSPVVAKPSGTARPAPAPAPVSLSAESRALAQVKRALVRADAPRALALLAEQDRQFAHGALHEERAAARVLALCDAGNAGAAREHAARFATRYPASLLKARVEAACRGKVASEPAPGSSP